MMASVSPSGLGAQLMVERPVRLSTVTASSTGGLGRVASANTSPATLLKLVPFSVGKPDAVGESPRWIEIACS